MGDNIQQFCYDKGVETQFAGPQEHSSIGGVESYGGKQAKTIRAQLAYGGAPAKYVIFAAKNYSHVQKLLPRSGKLGSSPYEIEKGIKDPHITGNVRTLFCEAWSQLNPETKSDRDEKHVGSQAERCVLLATGGKTKDGPPKPHFRPHIRDRQTRQIHRNFLPVP
jgi:hypothetical protein